MKAAKSYVDEISQLEVGETFVSAQKMEGKQVTIEEMKDVSRRMTNTISTACVRAGKRTELSYAVDQALHITRLGDCFVMVFVTAKAAE